MHMHTGSWALPRVCAFCINEQLPQGSEPLPVGRGMKVKCETRSHRLRQVIARDGRSLNSDVLGLTGSPVRRLLWWPGRCSFASESPSGPFLAPAAQGWRLRRRYLICTSLRDGSALAAVQSD